MRPYNCIVLKKDKQIHCNKIYNLQNSKVKQKLDIITKKNSSSL